MDGWRRYGGDQLLGRDQDSLPRLFGSLANACRSTGSLGDAAVGTRPVFVAADLLHAVCVISSARVIYAASLTKQQIDLTYLGNAYLSHTALITLFTPSRIQSALIHNSNRLFPTSVVVWLHVSPFTRARPLRNTCMYISTGSIGRTVDTRFSKTFG